MASPVAVVGASWGGTAAAAELLSRLSPSCGLAVVIAIHRGSMGSEDMLARSLQKVSPLPVVEAEDKSVLEPGRVLVAPADYHLMIEQNHVALSTEAPVRFSRPSIDVLFESAADSCRDRVVAVVLTGANDDGARGVVAVKANGGRTYAQDPFTAERPEMPDAAIATGAIDRVLPIPAIAAALDALGVQA